MQPVLTLREKKSLRVIGLMSGTSMDGIDICDADISLSQDEFSFAIRDFTTYSYNKKIRDAIERAFTEDVSYLCQLNFDLGNLFADAINSYLADRNISRDSIDLVGSHGHTIWHIHRKSTLQMGEAALIAEKCGLPVVADFRVRDVAAKGSGAPLVPFLDYLLFRSKPEAVLVLNIGGIANFSIIPKKCASVGEVQALDTGPGVCLINELTRRISKNTAAYDKDARLARKGKIRKDILAYLMHHSYLNTAPPKSTGRETFSPSLIDGIISRFKIGKNQYTDLLATLTRFTAEAIYYHYSRFFANDTPISAVIGSGGGMENPLIVSHLKELFHPVPIKRIEEYGIPPETKEAFAFAVLAVAFIKGIPSNLPQVTGAGHQVVMGKLSLP